MINEQESRWWSANDDDELRYSVFQLLGEHVEYQQKYINTTIMMKAQHNIYIRENKKNIKAVSEYSNNVLSI